MRHFSEQLKKILIRLTGCVLIPLFLFLPLLKFGIVDYNITGLLNLNGYRLLFHVLAIVLLLWIDGLFRIILTKKHLSKKLLIPLNILILLALFIPYEEGKSVLNTLHILMAYAAFAFFTCLFIRLIHTDQKYLTVFVMTGILCLFICLTAGKVTGFSEALFGSVTSILLALRAS